MNLKKIFLTSLTALMSTVSLAGEIDFDYEVIDGNIKVFGHLLEPRVPVQEVREDEESNHYMLFYQSPDERWVVIISDVHLTRTDVWLYDSDTTAAPVRVDAKRSGRHVGSEWHGSSVFEIYRAGMGNRISELFRVDDVARKRVIHDILLYEAEKDIYVRYFFDDGYKSWVALGRAFSTDRKEEKYPIELDIDYLSDAVFAIEEVKIDGSSLFVTHKKKDGTLVQETFPSDTLKGVR